MNNPWDKYVSDEEQERYARAGFYKKFVVGKPALLVVDMQYRMLGTRPQSQEEAIKEFPTSCGEAGWKAVPHIQQLCAQFRTQNWPIFHFVLGPLRAFAGGATSNGQQQVTLGLSDSPNAEKDETGFHIINELIPQPSEPVICKFGPSAFFGTPTASLLTTAGVDTLCVVGSTTSGCVRATVVDAFSYGFSTLVPFDCVFDRSDLSHSVSLFDMATRYANVQSLEETLVLLQQPNTAETSR